MGKGTRIRSLSNRGGQEIRALKGGGDLGRKGAGRVEENGKRIGEKPVVRLPTAKAAPQRGVISDIRTIKSEEIFVTKSLRNAVVKTGLARDEEVQRTFERARLTFKTACFEW